MTMTKMKEKTFLEGDNSAIDKELERVSVPDPNLEQFTEKLIYSYTTNFYLGLNDEIELA